jgi:glyoxylase-like metal-dependent hydrolase (beta-lactamase superfamily II)
MNSLANFSFEYGSSDQITPLVKRVIAKNPGPFTYTGTGTFIVGTKELAIIDPGPIDDDHLKAIIKTTGKNKISHIIVTHTHNDHSPLSKPLQEITGAPIYSYFNEAMDTKTNNQFEEGYDISFKPDVIVKDGDLINGFDWTLEAIHTPGHTSNHMCYSLLEEKILFSGDHVMGWSTTVIVPPDGDMDEYLKSLEKLLDRNDNIYLPTHGKQIDNPHDLVNKYIEHRINREEQIIKAIKSGNFKINEMVKIIYSDVDPGLHPAASMSTLAHLNRMIKNKIIKVNGKGLKADYNII